MCIIVVAAVADMWHVFLQHVTLILRPILLIQHPLFRNLPQKSHKYSKKIFKINVYTIIINKTFFSDLLPNYICQITFEVQSSMSLNLITKNKDANNIWRQQNKLHKAIKWKKAKLCNETPRQITDKPDNISRVLFTKDHGWFVASRPWRS